MQTIFHNQDSTSLQSTSISNLLALKS